MINRNLVPPRSPFEVPNWNLKLSAAKDHPSFKVAICDFEQRVCHMPLSRLMTHNTLFISVSICKLVDRANEERRLMSSTT